MRPRPAKAGISADIQVKHVRVHATAPRVAAATASAIGSSCSGLE